MRAIASAAGTTAPLIGLYFGGKEALYLAVHRAIQERAARALEQELAACDDPTQRPDFAFRFLAKFNHDCPTAPRLMVWWLLERGDFENWPGRDVGGQILDSVLQTCRAKGAIRADLDLDLVLLMFVALSHGWSALRTGVCKTKVGSLDAEVVARIEAAFVEQTSQVLRVGLVPNQVTST